MQDLYLKLDLDPAASSAEILQALEAKPEQSAAADILLNERRRAPYQRTVSTLRSIGLLRHRLGLDNDHTWFVETCPDFAPRLHGRKPVPQPAAAADTTGAATVAPSAGQSSPASVTPVASNTPQTTTPARSWLKPFLVLLAIAALLTLLIVVL
jgi:hypothetical protein